MSRSRLRALQGFLPISARPPRRSPSWHPAAPWQRAVIGAAAGGAAAGGIGALIARALGQEEAREIEDQIAIGGLVLWVRVRSPEREEKAQTILRGNGAEAVRVHEIEIDKRFENSPLDGLVVDPWLGSEPRGERT
jgi:hypothetical protein